MPRTSASEIPSTIKRSDRHAQRLWKKAHDSAEATYGGRGASARRVAFAALKHEYRKSGDRWVRKAQKGPSDPQAARGPTTRKKSTDPDTAPTAGGKVARTGKEAERKSKEAARERSRARPRRRASGRKKTAARRTRKKAAPS